jgi:kojibiose phosphorylase
VPTKIIKQADVVMMLNLFRTRFSTEVKKANWDYYEPRTEHGSSLSACAYAMVATEFGNLDFAYKYFLKTAKIDLEARYKVYVGSVFMGGSHPAANGGAWMTAILGFGGVEADENRVAINPRLCGKWKRLKFRLAYKGDQFRMAITKTSVTVVPSRANARAHNFLVAGRSVTCSPGRQVTITYRPTG